MSNAINKEGNNIVLKSISFENTVSTVSNVHLLGNVNIEQYEPNRIVLNVQTPQAGYLFLSDTYYPGWKAEIDNHSIPIHRAMDAFRAIEIPAGEHWVVFEYKPLSFTIGWVTSFITLLVLITLYICFRKRNPISLN